ncbi:67b6312e-7a8f-47fe-999f-00f8e41fa0f1 [Sclerotinia trifoliorum]|uniref:67b6312e-7a8f-47fe-999f-00f8e41fa0f1 n=1 Tax=Sclerotinia trifoliorum TaxID=28548 RepID=A0A8H2VRV7_9HELO|nr:67b6312e-7a8f-47fe-999f-00f8e41fa0f1 [Sclerotinia trifoliorum]
MTQYLANISQEGNQSQVLDYNSILKMTPIVADEAHGVGKLVALEGNINTITTQLRLLPHSHMILILAPLDHYLGEDHKREPFEARAFVRDVHIALTRRNEVARSFLRSSSQSKLAFLNGGSVSARAICVAKISQRLTYGNLAEAETIFLDIVKDGVAGLFEGTKPSSPSSKTMPIPEPSNVTAKPRAKLPKKLDLRSTKSATTLSEKDLPECEIDIEGSGTSGARNLRRSMADSGPQIIHIPGESRTITSRRSVRESQHGSDIVTTVVSIPSEPRISQINGTRCRLSQYSGTFGPRPSSSSKPSFSVPRSRYSTQPTTDIDEDEDYFEYISQDDDNLFSSPNVVYGEACVVDMQSALPTPTTPSWTKSIGDLLLHDDTKTSFYFKHAASTSDLRSSFNIPRRSFMKDSTFEQLPKAAFVKASKTTIRRSLTPNTPNFRDSIRSNSKSVPHAFKGCGAGIEDDLDLTKPVFDIAEDLIIHFTDNSPIEISRSISEYRSGNFPVSSPLLPRPLPTPPTTAPMATESLNSGQSVNQWRPRTHCDYQKSTEANSYFSHPPTQEEMERQKAFKRPLSTSASAIFPINKGAVEKFLEFSGAYSNKSIDIQNEFRSFLNFHFSEEAKALNQYQISVMFGSGAFWKDMFSNGSSTSCDGPAVDQIIAVGCEKGISDDFCTQLLRQVENIGVKKSGESRSGRLDLRFLIACAMQTFMSQPLLARKDLDPMTDPRLLADLIVPHLETYLATNSMVRFLVLSFPFDQIATVIALRSLLGSDLVKVAGVLDTLSSDPPSFAKPPLPKFHSSHHSFDAAVATDLFKRTENSQGYPLKSSPDALRDADPETILNRSSSCFSLFIKADYHLPSTASGPEIQNFLTLIRKNIVERLSWYNIEQVFLRPLPILSQTVIMKDASTSTEELLRADSDTDMLQFIPEQGSLITSSVYDDDLSEVEILRLPTHLSSRPSYFPAISRATSRPISPPPATPPRSSSYSASGSTIRHIPIAIERQSTSRDTIRPHDQLFPPPQTTQTQTHNQEQQAVYTYSHSTTSSASVPQLDRTHSDEISVNVSEVDLEVEVDSEDDAYDRMVMGCYSPMGARRRSMFLQTRFGAYGGGGSGSAKEDVKARAKGNSRKALKWLGLA